MTEAHFVIIIQPRQSQTKYLCNWTIPVVLNDKKKGVCIHPRKPQLNTACTHTHPRKHPKKNQKDSQKKDNGLILGCSQDIDEVGPTETRTQVPGIFDHRRGVKSKTHVLTDYTIGPLYCFCCGPVGLI